MSKATQDILKSIGVGLPGEGQCFYVFRIGLRPSDTSVDDLVGRDLAKLNVFIVADKPMPAEHLFVVTTRDDEITSARVLILLNDRFDLNADFVGDCHEKSK